MDQTERLPTAGGPKGPNTVSRECGFSVGAIKDSSGTYLVLLVKGLEWAEQDGLILDRSARCALRTDGVHLQYIVDRIREAAEEFGITIV